MSSTKLKCLKILFQDTRQRIKNSNYKPPLLHTKIIWLIYRYMLIIIRDPRVQLVRILQKLVSFFNLSYCICQSNNKVSF